MQMKDRGNKEVPRKTGGEGAENMQTDPWYRSEGRQTSQESHYSYLSGSYIGRRSIPTLPYCVTLYVCVYPGRRV